MRFISITKPGIIFGNIITAMGGYFLAVHSQANFNFPLFVSVITGMSLIIASGCVFNNYIDKDIDRLMERTRHRVLPQNLMSSKTAILYGIVLGILGFLVLIFTTNILTVLIALTGFCVYVIGYSLWFKRYSHYGTLFGGIAGAVPPLVGYCAITNHLDTGALLLFLILLVWQMPHFYAIAIYRLNDFKTARIPVLPIQKTVYYTKIVMLLYIFLFGVISSLLTIMGYTDKLYFFTSLILTTLWFYTGLRGLSPIRDTRAWARQMFLGSIIIITVLCFMMI